MDGVGRKIPLKKSESKKFRELLRVGINFQWSQKKGVIYKEERKQKNKGLG